ncbi:ATP-binding protein [Aquabacter sp. P-9]|uniref:ATP-binding protein n=1 Tax=Aquabacter sediminis TaxID=3029197 RepID=UPI00237E260B|nr:ATP-binding protein [Aquabacter sp. P-9]MDE1567290.1 ATP-binding protein [Aquabacter sp. P-9]
MTAFRPCSRLCAFIMKNGVLSAVLLVFAVCLPFTAAAVLYGLDKESQIRDTEEIARKTAILLVRSFEQAVEPVDALLQNFATNFDPDWTPTQTYEAIRSFTVPKSIVQVSVVDKNGLFIASNLAAPSPERIDLSDREHIRVQMNGSAGGHLFISKPVLGRVSKQWTIQLTRPLTDAKGAFAGVIVASYNIGDFIDFYKRLRLEDNMLIALVGFDGVVRARTAALTSFGDDISASPAFKAALGSRTGARYDEFSLVDGIRRIGYVVRSERYPVMVEVAFDESYVEAQTRDFRNAVWGTAVGLSICLLLLGLLAGRYLTLTQRLRAQEVETLAREWEAHMLEAISRVPGISVLHVAGSRAARIGGETADGLADLVGTYVQSETFQAGVKGLKAPQVRTVYLPDGEIRREVQLVAAPLAALPDAVANSKTGGKDLVVFAVDQTSKRMEEDKLYQMSKLASLGEVATGLAHEINQPLGVIRLAATNALNGLTRGMPPTHMESKLHRIIQQTVRMSRIIDHMRIFGRKSSESFEPSDPVDAIDGALQVVGAQLRLDNIAVIITATPGLAQVLCRQDQLEQVLINLLQNARDAIHERRKTAGEDFHGRIEVTQRLEDTATLLPPTVRIDVTDNAGGVPEAIMDKVFQPFFTTKPPGKGTGLGLSVSFGIVRDHGGTLSLANGKEGAIFTLRLPGLKVRQDQTAPAPSSDEARERASS